MRRHRPGPWRAALAAAVLLAVAGCGSAPRPYPVRGQILFEDGTPARELAGGTVTFNSDELQVSASSAIDADGRFHLSGLNPGDGTPAGRYQVAVVPPEADPDDDAPGPEIIEPHYSDPELSGLVVTVAPADNEVTLVVHRKGSRGTGR